MFKLLIGNKNLSSWSLRPWLVLKMLEEPFEEQKFNLKSPDIQQQLQASTPAGKVPVLQDRNLKIWDSLAICEYLAECFPSAGLWPVNSTDRAIARAMVAEMHSGFLALRQQMPMDVCHLHPTPKTNPDLQRDLARMVTLWQTQRHQNEIHGPFLFGHFTIVDAFFAPVVFRLAGYQIELPTTVKAYVEHMLALPAMREWAQAAAQE